MNGAGPGPGHHVAHKEAWAALQNVLQAVTAASEDERGWARSIRQGEPGHLTVLQPGVFQC